MFLEASDALMLLNGSFDKCLAGSRLFFDPPFRCSGWCATTLLLLDEEDDMNELGRRSPTIDKCRCPPATTFPPRRITGSGPGLGGEAANPLYATVDHGNEHGFAEGHDLSQSVPSCQGPEHRWMFGSKQESRLAEYHAQ